MCNCSAKHHDTCWDNEPNPYCSCCANTLESRGVMDKYATNHSYRLAKDVPIGTKMKNNFTGDVGTVIYTASRQGNLVVVLENLEGQVWCDNIGDMNVLNKGY